jgi:5'-3' exonuclease
MGIKTDDNISNDIIETYCVMCSLMGNDFIPHLLTLNFKSNGYEKLISYTGNSIRKNGLLVSEGKINYNTLIDIFQELISKPKIKTFIEKLRNI